MCKIFLAPRKRDALPFNLFSMHADVSLKSPEAMKRNVAKTLDVLKGNEARFMGRGLKDGV